MRAILPARDERMARCVEQTPPVAAASQAIVARVFRKHSRIRKIFEELG